MANEKKQAKDATETVNGRKVQHYADGLPSVYLDTGEVYDAAAAEEYALLYAGAGVEDAKHEAVNAPILFWQKVYIQGEDERKNPIRGFLLGFFEPPESFSSPTDEEEGDEVVPAEVSQGARKRLACWIKTTLPVYVKDQNKVVVQATVGSIVWVDVTHANSALVLAARPLIAGDGTPIGVVEVEVAPLRKVSFQSKTKKGETWSAWRMRVSGGWRQARDDAQSKRKGGFRTLGEAEIQKLGHRLNPPEVIDMDRARELAGVSAGQAPALSPAPTHAMLSAHAPEPN